MYRIAVVGGGAAGMMAAAAAKEAAPRIEVVLFEKNEKTGKKLYITGKGRCNLTNAMETPESFRKIMRNPKFLYSAIYSFDHDAVMAFFEESGVRLKTERGGRVFPASDHASDISRALEKRMKRAGVEIRLNTPVRRILTSPDGSFVTGVETIDGKKAVFDAVIIATGGISYPKTGSTGDGYRFALESGHEVTNLRPSLVPMETHEKWCTDLSGLSLRNVTVRMYAGKKCIAEEFGEMLFTHFGVSGPLVLSLSAVPTDDQIKEGLRLEIDLKPALTDEQLDARILRDLEKYHNKEMENALKDLLPRRLIPVVLSESGIPPQKRARDLSKTERSALGRSLKHLTVTVKALRGYSEAVITRGGVSVKDINASTMESKKMAGLYFAGEVIDTDALTGGYNLQIAWSTGHLAGESAARNIQKSGKERTE